jgi:hypothetical protein
MKNIKTRRVSFRLFLLTVFILLLLTAIGVAPTLASPGDTGTTGIWSWTELSDGTLRIESCTAPNGQVAIPASLNGKAVTAVDDWAFAGDVNLTGITVPAGVTRLGSSAFSGCTQLASAILPSTLTSMGDGAFYGCSSLATIDIPDTINVIPDSAFSGCSGLTSVDLPSSLASLGSGAFYGCSGLTSLVVPDGATTFSDSAFAGCTSLTTIHLPSALTSLGSGAFYGDIKLAQVSLPKGLAHVWDSAFAGCTSLTEVRLPAGLGALGEGAFYGCANLSRVVVQSTTMAFWDQVFTNTKLSSDGIYGFTGSTSQSYATDNGIPFHAISMPTITWVKPVDIVYGTPLGATQLNASATDPTTRQPVSGTFTYNPGSSTVLAVGSHSLHVDFQPNDGSKYSDGSADVSINVKQVNHAPSFTKGADQLVRKNASAQTIAKWATNISPGPSESGQSLDFVVTNDSHSLFSVQPSISPSGTLTFTPSPNVIGTATVTVTLHDNGGKTNGGVDTSAAQAFKISVCNRYDQTDKRLHYTGKWWAFAHPGSWLGAYWRSTTPGASVTINFTGTRLDWIATIGVTLSKADVYVDGVKKATIEMHRDHVERQQDVFSTGYLSNGKHTVKIVRTAGDPATKFISIDALDIVGTLIS